MILEKLNEENHTVILLDIGSRQDCQANLGFTGGVDVRGDG